MAKLYKHQNDQTYYTKVYRGGIFTLQIHPAGVDYLFRRGTHINSEIDPDYIRDLTDRGWLFTKDEVHGMGEIDWTYDGWQATNLIRERDSRNNGSVPRASRSSEFARDEHRLRVRRLVDLSVMISDILEHSPSTPTSMAPGVIHSIAKLQSITQSLRGLEVMTNINWARFYGSLTSLYGAIPHLTHPQLLTLSIAISELRDSIPHPLESGVQSPIEAIASQIEDWKELRRSSPATRLSKSSERKNLLPPTPARESDQRSHTSTVIQPFPSSRTTHRNHQLPLSGQTHSPLSHESSGSDLSQGSVEMQFGVPATRTEVSSEVELRLASHDATRIEPISHNLAISTSSNPESRPRSNHSPSESTPEETFLATVRAKWWILLLISIFAVLAARFAGLP